MAVVEEEMKELVAFDESSFVSHDNNDNNI